MYKKILLPLDGSKFSECSIPHVEATALSQNERANTFLGLVGERILAHSDKAPFEFKFSIIRSSAINAFATPGGYVYVNQGLITLVEDEAELAGVLAHEISHVLMKHHLQAIKKGARTELVAEQPAHHRAAHSA